jgi:hypothetical protein
MFQYAADHTGCFVFSDTVSAKLACNDGATPITEKDCVCGGYTPDLKCNAAIDTDQTTCDKPGTTLGTQPPSVCELSNMNVLNSVGKPWATCSSNPVGKDSVYYTWQETSPLEALAAFPKWLGKFGSDLLGAGESWIKKIGWILLWIVVGIVGVVILAAIIRFVWKHYISKSDDGGGTEHLVIEGASPHK